MMLSRTFQRSSKDILRKFYHCLDKMVVQRNIKYVVGGASSVFQGNFKELGGRYKFFNDNS